MSIHSPLSLIGSTLILASLPTASLAAASTDGSVQLNFPGGSLSQFVSYTQELVPKLNVIVEQDARDVEIPAFRITVEPIDDGDEGEGGYSAGERIIEEMLPNLVTVNTVEAGRLELLEVMTMDMGFESSSQDTRLYTIGISEHILEIEASRMERRVLAVGLAPFLERYQDADVLAAIEAAISGTLGDEEQQEWSIQYHEATHIAFINVSESMADAAEEAIEQVADALFSGIRSRAHVGGDDDELVELHMELEEVVEQYAAMQDALAELEDEIAQLRGINEQLERALNATRQSGNADGRD